MVPLYYVSVVELSTELSPLGLSIGCHYLPHGLSTHGSALLIQVLTQILDSILQHLSDSGGLILGDGGNE